MSRAMVALVALVVAGCGGSPVGRVIDGWPIGEAITCADVPAPLEPGQTPYPTCAERVREAIRLATAGLDRRDPGHAPVVRAVLYGEGNAVDDAGVHVFAPTRSIPNPDVAVFQLADGSTRAIGVGVQGIGPELHVFDYGTTYPMDPQPG